MSRFPIVNNLEDELVKAITNTDRLKFSGTKVFAALQCFGGHNNVPNGIIGNDSYYAFNYMDEINNHKRRIPPLLKSIEVKTAGSLGAIKKAEVTIQFSSMEELKNNRGYLQIGKTQLLVWGWSKDRNGAPQFKTPSSDLALEAINAAHHLKAVLGKDWDMHAGILTNFEFKLNENLTVDATLELSQPSDIPAFLALANKKKTAHVEKTDDDTSKPFAEAAQAAALDPNNNSGAAYTALLNYTINIDDAVFDWTYGNTDSPYIAFGYICKVLANKSKVLKMEKGQRMDIDIDNAIAGGRERMISVSEHVIIPCPGMPKTKEVPAEINGKTLKGLQFDTANETFAPISLGSNVFQFPEPNDLTKWGVTLKGNQYGYLSSIFISADFLKEAAKGCETTKDFLEKIIREMNIAGAGLWNLALRDIEDDEGWMTYTIVDYNLTHDISPPPVVDLFSKDSTVTNVDLQADLPKEVAGQAMLGSENSGHDESPGTAMFNENPGTDPILGKAQAVDESFEAANANKNSGEKVQQPDNKGIVAGLLDAAGDALSLVTGLVTAVVDEVKAVFAKMFNAPAECQVKLSKKPYYADGGSDAHFVVFKEAGQVKNLYFGKGHAFKNSLLPVKLNFTTLGIGGFVIGKAMNVNMIPWLDSSKGFWQITDVKHSIDDTKWTTNVEIRFRVKY